MAGGRSFANVIDFCKDTLKHLIAITDEQLRTGRVPTENELYNHKVDMAVKNVMELAENLNI